MSFHTNLVSGSTNLRPPKHSVCFRKCLKTHIMLSNFVKGDEPPFHIIPPPFDVVPPPFRVVPLNKLILFWMLLGGGKIFQCVCHFSCGLWVGISNDSIPFSRIPISLFPFSRIL